MKRMKDDYIIIAGPCSVESKEQLYVTAKELAAEQKPDFFRAGLWKPRTRPNCFEGVGSKGLEWLKMVQEEFEIPVITEVGSAKHIEKVLKYNITSVWIGARTVANPFSVQEIAEAIKGNGMNVFVKNPIYPDVDLWTGAIERISGVADKTFAIHRGFYPFSKTNLRNVPQWEIPIELLRRIPDINIICDPSHISGHKKYIKDIAQKSIDLDMTGLMLECHHNPMEALCDKEQQLTPKELKQLISELSFKKPQIEDVSFVTELENLRNKIDVIDLQMIDMLEHRFKLVDEIGRLKKDNKVVVLQIERWKKIIESRLDYSDDKHISKEFLLKLLQIIHKESIRRQTDILKP